MAKWGTVLLLLMVTGWTQSKQVTRRLQTTKCQYTLVFREMECPSVQPYDRNGGSAMHSDAAPVGVPHTDTAEMSRLAHRVNSLETKMFEEKIHNLELKTTLAAQREQLAAMDKEIKGYTWNASSVESAIHEMHETVSKQRDHVKSVEAKLSALMLDLDEVNHQLQSRDQSLTSKQAKVIGVENLSSVSICSHSDQVPTFRDCEQVYNRGHTKSGVYYIKSQYTPCAIPVYCDMDTPPGGWLMVLCRQDGHVNFTQNWTEYRDGFGDVNSEHWLGLSNLFLLSNQAHYQLRVDLWDFYGSRVYAEYRHFRVEGERDRYRLHVSNHTGTAPDGLSSHNGMHFSTPDRDNDAYTEYHCAKEWHSGWWFANCWFAILTGQYHDNLHVQYKGIAWNDWKNEQLKHAEMKIRPSGY